MHLFCFYVREKTTDDRVLLRLVCLSLPRRLNVSTRQHLGLENSDQTEPERLLLLTLYTLYTSCFAL